MSQMLLFILYYKRLVSEYIEVVRSVTMNISSNYGIYKFLIIESTKNPEFDLFYK